MSKRIKSTPVVRVRYGRDMRPHTIAEFKRTKGLPEVPGLHPTPGLIASRVRAFQDTVNEVVPAGTTVTIWPTIDMATTLGQVAPERFGPASGVDYSLNRGANTAVAKTLARPGGKGFDIVVSGDMFISTAETPDADVAEASQLLAHLAAHEPQHIVLTLAGLDPEHTLAAARGDSPTLNDLIPAAAEAVNEYQAELAANRIVLSSMPHDAEALSDDLSTFRAALAEAVRTQESDRHGACLRTLTAAKEMLKAVAYAAALQQYDGDDRTVPEPKPEQWDRYMRTLWPDLLEMFAAIPAAGEPAPLEDVATVVQQMTERLLTWLEEIGVTYRVEVEAGEFLRYCWWSIAEPI